jgi:allantoinase
MTVEARVVDTFLRGRQVLEDGKIVGAPTGAYLRRPTPQNGGY